MAFKISNIYKSLVRQIVDTMEEARGVSPDLQYFAWDSADEVAELPNHDLIGLAGWTFSENRGLWQVHAGITISTLNDLNLFRETDLVDIVHDKWGEKCPIPLRDDAGTEIAQLVVEEFELLAAGRSEKRNFRPIGLTLLRASNG